MERQQRVDSDGGYAETPVILDGTSNLYGATFHGGDMNCAPGQGCGTVFKIDPSGKETVIYAFKSLVNGFRAAN